MIAGVVKAIRIIFGLELLEQWTVCWLAKFVHKLGPFTGVKVMKQLAARDLSAEQQKSAPDNGANLGDALTDRETTPYSLPVGIDEDTLNVGAALHDDGAWISRGFALLLLLSLHLEILVSKE